MSKKTAPRRKTPPDLLVALQQAQESSGYLTPARLAELAAAFAVPVNDVYGVASFYSFLVTKPCGRNVIRVCRSLPCYLKNSPAIIETVEKEIGIRPGGTTPDGRFSFELTNCIGLCDRPPAMLVNSDPHVDLTPVKIARILKNYK
jgi:NADH:ubiquinone oxidoreductase subunit E